MVGPAFHMQIERVAQEEKPQESTHISDWSRLRYWAWNGHQVRQDGCQTIPE
jgi:hypothetical protein